MICKVCDEDKTEHDFQAEKSVCKQCVQNKRRSAKTRYLEPCQMRVYGQVLTFDTTSKPSNLNNETVLAIVADMRNGSGLLQLVDKYHVHRDVVVDICGGKAYADVTGIPLERGKRWSSEREKCKTRIRA